MNNEMVPNIPEIHIENYHEKFSNFLVMEINELFNEYSNMLISPHRISYYQVVLVMEGEINFQVDSQKYKGEAGTLFTVGKGQVEVFEPFRNSTGYIIFFTDEYIYKYPEDMKLVDSLNLFNHSTDPSLINLSDAEYAEILALIKKIAKEFNSGEDFAKDDILVNLLKTLLLISGRMKRTKINSGQELNGDLCYLVEFKKALERNFSRSRSVKYYAGLLNITPKKLNQVTSHFWGKPVKRVIEERVLLETKRLLIHTNKTVKEIGDSLGFSEPTNFNKFFKKHENATPADFRLLSK